ncbi:MAG: tetratricopeptide repeat protein [Chloroflexota bacterium]|nr:tetratricopeptide repeat protein [Chloroflexota bacterium]
MAIFEVELDKWNKALEATPEDVAARLSRANLYVETECYAEAEADFSELLARDPHEVAALFGRGSLYGRMKRYAEALKDLNAALECEASAEIFNNRGNVLDGLGQHQAAIADYSQALELAGSPVPGSETNRNLAVYYKNRGISQRESGEYGAAFADFDEALRLQNDFADAYVQRGLTYAAMGDPVAAIEDFDVAIALDPTSPVIYYNRALAHRRSNNLNGAIADYSSAIELSGQTPSGPMPEALFNRAALYRAIHRLVEATNDLHVLLALPELAGVYRDRAEKLLAQLS